MLEARLSDLERGSHVEDRPPVRTGISIGDSIAALWGVIGALMALLNALKSAQAYMSVGDLPAIVPTIEGWAIRTGTSQITLDDRDPYMAGFSVTGTGVTVYPGP